MIEVEHCKETTPSFSPYTVTLHTFSVGRILKILGLGDYKVLAYWCVLDGGVLAQLQRKVI